MLLSVQFTLPGVFNDNLYKSAVNGSLWTLPSEIALYLILPILVKIFKLNIRGFTAICIAIFFVIMASQSINTSSIYTFDMGFFNSLMQNIFVFFLGALISYTKQEQTNKKQIIFLLLIILSTAKTYYGMLALMIALPFLVIKIGSIFNGFIFIKNDISYGAYIYAFPVQQSIYYIFHNKISASIMMLMAFLIISALAYLSWYLIERPFMKNRMFFAKKILGGSAFDPSDERLINDKLNRE